MVHVHDNCMYGGIGWADMVPPLPALYPLEKDLGATERVYYSWQLSPEQLLEQQWHLLLEKYRGICC